MKFLADENFPGTAVQRLREAEFDIEQVSGTDAGTTDELVLQRSYRDERILLTMDMDFGELIFRRNLPAHGVVLFRLIGLSKIKTVNSIVNYLQRDIDWTGQFSVVTQHKLRQRILNS